MSRYTALRARKTSLCNVHAPGFTPARIVPRTSDSGPLCACWCAPIDGDALGRLRAAALYHTAREAGRLLWQLAEPDRPQRPGAHSAHAAALAALRPGFAAREKSRDRARQAAAGDRNRSQSGQDLLVRGVGLSRRPAARSSQGNPRTLSTPTPRRLPTPIGSCSTRGSIAFAIRTIRSFAARATSTTTRWPRRCGWSSSKTSCVPARRRSFRPGKKQFQVDVVLRGPWHAEDIDRLEFVNDYEARRRPDEPVSHVWPGRAADCRAHEPRGGIAGRAISIRRDCAFPSRPSCASKIRRREQAAANVHRCTLELYDPLFSSDIAVCNRLVPLETDLTTPLAYFLDNPVFKQNEVNLATSGLFNPNQAQAIKGLYMVEPYRPEPHSGRDGPWPLVEPDDVDGNVQRSAGFPEIRSRYQFWFYLYPTGQPFWVSAAQLRETLAEVRQTLDPAGPQSATWTRWCSSATAWAGWFRSCKRSKAATNSGASSPTSRSRS